MKQVQWIDICPKCNENTLECINVPNDTLWSRICNNCNYIDKRNYYEDNKGQIHLYTERDAIENKLLIKCPLCKTYCNCWQIEKYKVCFSCEINTDIR